MGRIVVGFLARIVKSVSVDAHFRDELAQKLVDDVRELLQTCVRRHHTYLVDRCILQLVFFLIVEDQTVFLDKAHNWRLPAWAFEECNQTVENPILQMSQC